jgi:hypothetical protein
MDPTNATKVAERLFAGDQPVYALLDAARAPEVYQAIQSSGLPVQCLYDGELPNELAEVAPYLVRLRPGRPFVQTLLEQGWGQSWGCFVTSPIDARELRKHLRRFLRVQTEEGKNLVFRYYDPRVLRVYLPTCTADELATFFGPIARFLVEDQDGAAALSFERDGAAVTFSRLVLPVA